MIKKLSNHRKRIQSFVKTGLALPTAKRLLGMKPKKVKCPELGAPIIPSFFSLEQHVCFGCSPRNQSGLRLDFFEVNDWDIATKWNTRTGFENYPGMVHGGLITTALDELIGQAIFKVTGHMPVSLTANITWLKALRIGDSAIGAARIISKHDTYYKCEAYLFRPDGRVAAKLEGLYLTPTLDTFRAIAELDSLPEYARGWFVQGR